MDLKSFVATASKEFPKFSPRQRRLYALRQALESELYAARKYAFSQETSGEWEGDRIALDKRRPSVEYTLPEIAVRDHISMLFGEEHRPSVLVRDDDDTNDWIVAFIEDTNLWWHMIDLATGGSVGTAVFVTRVLGPEDAQQPGRFYHESWPAEECQPFFKREAPTQLDKIVRTYYISEDALKADGYDIKALKTKWISKDGRTRSAKEWARAEAIAILGGDTTLKWVMRVQLDAQSETWYDPVPRFIYEAADFKDSKWTEDADRSSTHDLGEVPALWIRNAPGKKKHYPDGACLWEAAVNFQLRIDKTMAQTGRAFDYCGDPQAWRATGGAGGPGFGEDEGATDATASGEIEVPEKGGAGFIEIKGDGLKVAIETYISQLKTLARESCGASRIDPETVHQGVLSGAGMKMLNAGLLQCVGILRMSYGDNGIIPILKLCMRIAAKVNVELPSLAALLERRQREDQRRAQVKKVTQVAAKSLDDPTVGCGGGCGCCDKCSDGCDGSCCAKCGQEGPSYSGEPNPECLIELNWPTYYEPTGQDFAQQVAGIVAAVQGQVISQETGVANAAGLFDVPDATKESDRIADQQAVTRAQTATDAKNEAQNSEKAKADNAPPAGK